MSDQFGEALKRRADELRREAGGLTLRQATLMHSSWMSLPSDLRERFAGGEATSAETIAVLGRICEDTGIESLGQLEALLDSEVVHYG